MTTGASRPCAAWTSRSRPANTSPISGPSGSGKFHVAAYAGRPRCANSGEVLFRGSLLGKRFDLDTYRSCQVGFIFQAFHLLPTLRAVENVQVPCWRRMAAPNHRLERASALLEEMGLKDRMKHFPTSLSAGERQRVAIARALANEPAIPACRRADRQPRQRQLGEHHGDSARIRRKTRHDAGDRDPRERNCF